MHQRDIYLANLNPSKGSEQAGKRPVVVISGDTMNDNLGVVIVCPISTKFKNFESCVRLKKSSANGLKSDSEIITFQVRTVSKDRLSKRLGQVSKSELNEVLIGLFEVLKY